ncbi:lysoplasmalogenase [Ottowia testudinis]|uniref:Lysoplasmalogenase n=1 Tax=Ottowia testudinis TaxID=2816950 RepID=A0A975H512_9BURK|nr:lysoplasmalogenase [Ottowia testudinis]QTD46950.1 lysoplasmalogenase [Ottowia testudinis]
MLALPLTFVCLLFVAALLVAERAQRAGRAGIAKTAASASFIALAVSLGALSTAYGVIVLAALVLSALGDVALAFDRPAAFMAGLGFFLLAHIAFSMAFAQAPWSWVLAVAAAGMAVAGALSLRWLWPHLGAPFKVPVVCYVVAIVVMCAWAVAFSAATGHWQPAVGALLFAASDLAVARQAFVAKTFLNKAWGLPTYYAAQLLMAWSITTGARG